MTEQPNTEVVIKMTVDEFKEALRDIVRNEFKSLAHTYDAAIQSIVERDRSYVSLWGHIKRFLFNKP